MAPAGNRSTVLCEATIFPVFFFGYASWTATATISGAPCEFRDAVCIHSYAAAFDPGAAHAALCCDYHRTTIRIEPAAATDVSVYTAVPTEQRGLLNSLEQFQSLFTSFISSFLGVLIGEKFLSNGWAYLICIALSVFHISPSHSPISRHTLPTRKSWRLGRSVLHRSSRPSRSASSGSVRRPRPRPTWFAGGGRQR